MQRPDRVSPKNTNRIKLLLSWLTSEGACASLGRNQV
jgi:hypothetical protein